MFLELLHEVMASSSRAAKVKDNNFFILFFFNIIKKATIYAWGEVVRLSLKRLELLDGNHPKSYS